MQIALYGISGLYNYGCEAIVRGSELLFHKLYPDAVITYYSKRPNEDLKIVSDININVEGQDTHLGIVLRAVNRISRLVGLPFRFKDDSFEQIIRGSDIIVSIGGDIYTIPAYLRKKKKYPYYNKTLHLSDSAISDGKSVVLYGASIGPFGEYKAANDYYISNLKRLSLILAREKRCISFLNNHGVFNNVLFMPDPAFLVMDHDQECPQRKYLGINLSPLSIRELYGEVSDETYQRFAGLIEKIQMETGMQIMLIPHVISPTNPEDNDLLFMNKIYSMIQTPVREKIIIAEGKSFLQIKKDIRKCRIIVAARMHCAINSICEAVPVIFLSYSEKAKGMAEFVYGDTRWIISVKDVETSLSERINELLLVENKMTTFLKTKVSEIRNQVWNDSELDRIRGALIDESTK